MARSSTRAPAITDVARLAGVSVPTVSRVITGSVPVSAERKERVHSAIRELGYRPNGAARALVTGRQSAIAVIASNTTRYGYATTLQGIEESARAAGFIVMITVIESDEPEAVSAAVDLALSHPVSGAVVLKFDPAGAAALRALPTDLPVVAVAGGKSDARPHAVLDDTAAAKHATEYLLGLGHSTVHYVAVPTSGRRAGRAAGWRKALEHAGVEPPPIYDAGWDPQRAYEFGRGVAERSDVTAALCGNDELAMAFIRALQECGRRVPDEISVVGFDDHPLSRYWTPPLTTVRQDFADLGRRSFELLGGALDGDGVRSSSVTPRLVLRESAGPVPSSPSR
ncbi:LacI family transcriptional regulator [Haloactinopolyspora alba]|uniref:LacI family transcriptional regulator n=1 Tax=Haloactinopolyspora alba TaxID=648780 RepID=A0A2P8DKW7_9ACTN|nr:LacI family DNA-binding transcriptional regulator [Haloactinopolyspora alba]PSK97866.1 LacI family transcriptional regulator [Haloactinopolyspora alba]